MAAATITVNVDLAGLAALGPDQAAAAMACLAQLVRVVAAVGGGLEVALTDDQLGAFEGAGAGNGHVR
jgi:hypothetical protein